jgi:hypothetical protein
MEKLDKRAYLKRLNKLRIEIESNKEGAYAHWLQDRANLALFSSAGSSGILVVILEYWTKQ